MSKNRNIIYKSSSAQIIQIILWIGLLGWIGFAIFMFNANPIFFSVSIGVSLLAIILNSRTEVLILQDSIQINKVRIIPFLTNKKTFFYVDIKSVSYEKGDTAFIPILNILLDVLSNLHSPHISQNKNRLILYFNNNGELSIELKCSDTQCQKIYQYIGSNISKTAMNYEKE